MYSEFVVLLRYKRVISIVNSGMRVNMQSKYVELTTKQTVLINSCANRLIVWWELETGRLTKR
jgi:hypothetical protein